MNKDQWLVLTLLGSGCLFVCLAAWAALSTYSTPVIVEVTAPAGVSTNVALMDPADLASAEPANLQPLLMVAQDNNATSDDRTQAIKLLAGVTNGSPEQGYQTFRTHCISCHAARGEGANIGPNLSDVALRLPPDKIVESIVHPSAVVEEQYKTTMILTLDGDVITGLLVESNDEQVKLYDGKDYYDVLVDDIDEQATKEQSGMPERLADAMQPSEFIDLVAFLATMKEPPAAEDGSE